MLADVLALTLGGILGESLTAKLSSRADRRRLARGQVRCTIRAVEGRVLNIGTEWSVGVCELQPGRFRFTPEMGVVGDRDIEVLAVERATLGLAELPVAPAPTNVYVLTTPAGELYWVIPRGVADAVRERVLATAPPRTSA